MEKIGLVIWLTGLPSSGKTTISKEIEKLFTKNKLPIERLDGDIFRKKNSLGFTKKDRDENIRLAAKKASLLSKHGLNVVAAFIFPYQEMRAYARKICPFFVEIFVKCNLEECIKRDVKGMYKKALAGEIKDFTGIHDPYEEPDNPELILETDKYSEGKILQAIHKYLISINIL